MKYFITWGDLAGSNRASDWCKIMLDKITITKNSVFRRAGDDEKYLFRIVSKSGARFDNKNKLLNI